ncbi:Uma2 family endonuclease [Spirulina sp. CCNP1310]|uniref:Uma2 family endonuclease n=1 Tax=Spirulina sp. CCNP1310 TaxID=3110249 RepID=UPI002B1FBCC2|nr:Uma2 family endonuclease [Spirulina sp. CCNP1310]MEA5420372.1 Uma2 family endonuclease [Spirulina sp. CCNP1310]
MTLSVDRPLLYPDRDGQSMADNTRQFQWIVLIKENLEWIFADDPQVFIAGDLLWYPIQGDPKTRVAPDVLVVFGRPKGDRGSYKQWEEDNIAPQVVFEILSPGNTLQEMLKKQQFYDRHGVEEYYIYNPDGHDLAGLQRIDGTLTAIETVENWTSPRLGIRFAFTPENLTIYRPDGERFLTTIELATARNAERERADAAEAQAQQQQQRAERLAAQLRALGVEPEE